jgi:shikimate kinase
MGSHLWLVGMMGSGKSAVGPGLAQRLDLRFTDTDEEIAGRMGCSIAQFWGERGEEAFRDMESAAIGRISSGPAAVVATGGGAVLREGNVVAMRRSGRVAWLTAAPETLATRVGPDTHRPLLTDGPTAGRIAEILTARSDLYAAAADVVIDTESSAPSDIVDRIEAWWIESS